MRTQELLGQAGPFVNVIALTQTWSLLYSCACGWKCRYGLIGVGNGTLPQMGRLPPAAAHAASLVEVRSLRVGLHIHGTAQVFWTAGAAGGASCLPKLLNPFRLASILVICIWLQASRGCHLLHLPACVLARRGEACSATVLSCRKCDARCFEGSVLLVSAIYTG